MNTEGLIVQTKLTPIRPLKSTLPRPRLTERLLQALDYPVTILQAGTGYGKTTALAELAHRNIPIVWYHLEAEDADRLVFLTHLLRGFYGVFDSLSSVPMALIGAWTSSHLNSPAMVADALVNELNQHLTEHALLILDDAHLLNESPEVLELLERLIKHAPPTLHIILSCRQNLGLNNLIALRVRGQLLEIGEGELTFTRDEIGALFGERYSLELSPQEVDLLARETEGWAIALQLVWQGLSRSASPQELSDALRQFTGLKGDLFAYLAQEVLEKQPDDLQEFLLDSSVLRELSGPICDHLTGRSSSHTVLRHLLDAGLFVVEIDAEHVRYHTLFREFLYARLPEARRGALHLRAAHYCHARGDKEDAVHHFLRAPAYEEAADLILETGRMMINGGRLESLSGWMALLPPQTLEARPGLLTFLGDIDRLHSRFAEAMRWYRQGEERCRLRADLPGIAQALRGQARIYLDTVNPAMAEAPLREALRLSDGQEDRESRATLLEMLAENQLNLGHSEEARTLQMQARRLREEGPGQAELDVRVMLRTGRLDEAVARLNSQVDLERRAPIMRPRAHRETLLLLSLLEVLRGDTDAAYQHALEGTARGRELDSPFVTAVGYMRQGHSWLTRGGPEALAEARRCFEEAIAISEQLDVLRLKVEANWGLCRAFGYSGDLPGAKQAAQAGIEIARQAGDEWIIAHISVALGAVYVLAGQYGEAMHWLAEAEAGFRECSDTFGVAVVRLWKCIAWHESGDPARLMLDLSALLSSLQSHNYEYLITRRTLAGPPDPRRLVPVLLAARSSNQHGPYVAGLLKQIGLERIQIHPGYQLRVQALGPFRVWLGEKDVSAGDWQREKARQLFQLLLTSRRIMLDRDVICDQLWPDLTPDAAQRDFKVALNALYRVLEPGRASGAPSAYVARDGSLYGLRPEADVWLDSDEFERAVAAGDATLPADRAAALADYRRALALYQGDYLEEYIYEDWCCEERDRLRALYLRAADRLARALLEDRDWERAVEVCQSIIARDDCWENAYRLMMVGHARLGNRAQALRIYQNLADHLRHELDADPAPETEALYHLIMHTGLPDLP